MRPVIVLACGSPDRGDDAAGIAVLELLEPFAPDVRAAVDVQVVGQLGLEHLADRPAEAAVIVVDAAVGLRPGTVRFVPFRDLAEGARSPVPRSSHELPIPEVVGIAELIGGPLEGGVLVIGGGDFSLGAALSPAVAAGLPEMAHQLGHAVADLARGSAGVATATVVRGAA